MVSGSVSEHTFLPYNTMNVSAGGRSKILAVQALIEGLNLLPPYPAPLNSDRVKVYAKYWGVQNNTPPINPIPPSLHIFLIL